MFSKYWTKIVKYGVTYKYVTLTLKNLYFIKFSFVVMHARKKSDKTDFDHIHPQIERFVWDIHIMRC